MTTAKGARPPEVVFFPIRHHSPACSLALKRALDEIRPAQVLVEAPVDFASLIPALTDSATVPPVAIVSLPDTPDPHGVVSTYPFCSHSPELIALTWARAAGVRTALVDLPARHEDMQRRFGESGQGALIEDWRLDHNAYVTELCARRGVRDGAALWDALFETDAAAEWRGFFSAVGAYCDHIRQVTTAEEMARDGTLVREAHMIAALHASLGGGGPIAVITGGFHTPALQEGLKTPPAAFSVKAPPQRAYLIRYGFRQLDRASGYGAGLPHAGWYDRLWKATTCGRDTADLASEALTDFSDHLRRTAPALAFSTPVLSAAIAAADRLARLRELSYAGRNEILDAVRSTTVKEAIEIGKSPILEAFSSFLTGDALGELPPTAEQPPIVAAVRSQARSLGFVLEGGEKRNRDLDVLRKPRHAEASHFLFALDLIEVQFASRISGPDPISGWREDALFETWSYAWSPMVESRLIGRALDGETLEALCRAELVRRRALLAERGLSRSTAAVAELLLTAIRAGATELAREVLDWSAETLAEDVEVSSIVRALALTSAAAANGASALSAPCGAFRTKAFDRLMLLFPHLAGTPAERVKELTQALAELAALTIEDDAAIDRDALAAVLAEALNNPPPVLFGALTAFGGLIGVFDEQGVADRIAQALDGTYVAVGERAAALTGCLTVNPKLLVHSDALMSAADRFLEGLDAEGFLGVLPELRLALSQLTPSEIDRVAGWVAGRHDLAAHSIVESELPAAEVTANLMLSQRIETVWRQDGLSAWLGAPT